MSKTIFLCYKPCHNPTTVCFCERAHLDGASLPSSLVLGRRNAVEIYSVVGTEQRSLRLRAALALDGDLISLHIVRINESQQDKILLTLSPAKCVLAEYRGHVCRLEPIRMIDLEHTTVRQGLVENVSWNPARTLDLATTDNVTLTAVDELGRCAAVLVCGHQLAIIPFGPMHDSNGSHGNRFNESRIPDRINVLGAGPTSGGPLTFRVDLPALGIPDYC